MFLTLVRPNHYSLTMTVRYFTSCFIVTIILLSCHRLKDKAKQLSDDAKSKSKQLIDSAVNKILPDQKPDSFSIRSIVKDFQNDKSITEIRGIQTNQYFLYI